MNNVDKQYLDLLKDILENGVEKDTRAGKVKSVFGRMMRFNLKDGLPMLTTKKVFHRGCIEELLWFLKGSTNIKYLVERNVHIWDDDGYRHYLELVNKNNEITEEFWKGNKPSKQITIIKPVDKETFLKNVLEEKKEYIIKSDKYFFCSDKFLAEHQGFLLEYTYGDLGPVYGKQWRSFGISNTDQIQNIINTLKTNPDDRRMLCIAFNPDVLDKVALPPCHVMFQFYTKPLENGKRELSLLWTQRSVDSLLGLPINILSYSILLSMIAQVVDMEVGELICSLGDTHIYLNQMEGLQEQLSHDPYKYDLPKLELKKEIKDINQFTIDDIKIIGYESYPKIYFPLSVG